MSKFVFNLSPLVRVTTVEKSKVELELSNKLLELKQHQDQLSREHYNIKEMLSETESLLLKGKSITIFSQPYVLNEKLLNVKLLKEKIILLELERDKIVAKLGKIIGKINKLDDIRIEKLTDYKRELAKKDQEVMEEVYRNKNITLKIIND